MSRWRLLPVWAQSVILASATVVLYVATARLGLTLALPPEKKATAVWLPSGIALAAILLGGYRVWPAVWLGAFLANAWDIFDPASSFPIRSHLIVSCGIAVGSTLQPLLGAFLLRRWIGRDQLFDGARSAFKLTGITLLACLVASTIGVSMLAVAGIVPWPKFVSNWWTWWVGDTIGILIVTPLILSWSKPPWFKWEPRRAVEAVLLAGLLAGISLVVFAGMTPWSVVAGTLTYLAIPPLVWGSYRFGQHGATTGLLLVSKIAVWGTSHGHGPFVQPTLNESLLLLQTFVGVIAVTTLALAGVLNERRVAENAKTTAIGELERALNEIKTLRGLIPICAWCKKIRNDAGSWEQLEAYLRGHTEAEFSHSICPECVVQRHGVVKPGPDGPRP
jgi:integral membrane sensor domain MASE1